MTRFVSPARTRLVRGEVTGHRESRPTAPGRTISLWAVVGVAALMLLVLIIALENGQIAGR
ncbi:hypothetical protein [Plantactinospora endophytica]|uniref:Uncharacterized protein n=1 Tax=Plantactinospora endophytica TaxID=673535 RepID=A0ABQ4EAL7_9ACTN|nr:hypothetical protein [Plantactinospora endophytica]GIG91306.1 hypothetical protein Pen02_62420 [Plantactinospora endophytica]